MKRLFSCLFILAALATSTSCDSQSKRYYAFSLRESAVPVRPGIPGERPFWNKASFRFIYAPAFDFAVIENADRYLYVIDCADGKHFEFTAKTPNEPLSPVWKKVPVGYFKLSVKGLSAKGQELGTAGEGRYWRAAPFAGEYNAPPAVSYEESARTALDTLMNKYWVRSWLDEAKPHPDYNLYRYPTKIMSALLIGALLHASMHEGEKISEEDIKIAVTIGDYLLNLRIPEGEPWEWHTPTYRGYQIGQKKDSHMQESNMMTIYGTDAGNAWLDPYDATSDRKYLEAAVKIAETFVKRQLPCGSWYLYVNYERNEPIADLITIPTQIINYYDRLERDYGVKGLEESRRKALAWMEENVLKTFDWQGQFEDIKPRGPYENLSREQACDYAIYLMRNHAEDPESLALARELIRFSEDQFVVWEQPVPRGAHTKTTAHKSEYWITPCVMEQLVFWNPVGRSAAIMIETYMQAWKTTGEDIYLAKARSIGNSFVKVQQEHGGDYPTFFCVGEAKGNYWLNSVVYPARTLTRLYKAGNGEGL